MSDDLFWPGTFFGGLVAVMICFLTMGPAIGYRNDMINAVCGECPGSETCGDERQLVCSSGGWELSGAKK